MGTIREKRRDVVIAFAGGGTGGHIYPALATSSAIRERIPNSQFLFFCTERQVDGRILGESTFEVVRQPLRNLSKNPLNWSAILNGWRASRRLCRELLADRQPIFLLGTGGLASVPAVLEAKAAGIPAALLNPDAKPGRANRFLAGRIDAVFAQWEVTQRFLKGARIIVTGCPVRPEFRSVRREDAVRTFSLDPNKKTLLITGASQGARSINDALIAIAGRLRGEEGWQVLHLTGEADLDRVQKAYKELDLSGQALAYTDRMAEALAAADLVISRAGASTLAEITAMGRPSILMPYPYHKDQHQLENARCLARESAAQILRDEIVPDRNGPALWRLLQPLLSDDALRERVGAAAMRLGRVDAADVLVGQILRLVGYEAQHESVQATGSASR